MKIKNNRMLLDVLLNLYYKVRGIKCTVKRIKAEKAVNISFNAFFVSELIKEGFLGEALEMDINKDPVLIDGAAINNFQNGGVVSQNEFILNKKNG